MATNEKRIATKFLSGSFLLIVVCLLFAAPGGLPAQAQEFTSTDFKIFDPVMAPGGFSTSTDYQLRGAITQISIGTSTATGFNVSGGFLFFPFVSLPSVTAAAGDGKVTLSWTTATGALGWTVSGYNIGQSAISGGPYTYTLVGNVTSSVQSGLTNGTAYYFVVRPEDAFGNAIATSSEVSATPSGSAAPPPSGGVSGGGGGGGGVPSEIKVIFSGRAYPGSKVILLKDAQIAAQTVSDSAANFRISISGLSAGSYIFGIYSEDSEGRRSSLLTFPTRVTSGVTIEIGSIFIAPTIAVDKSQVKRGENIAIFGQSAPEADVTVSINSEEEFFGQVIADANGAYLYTYDTATLAMGQHLTKSKASTHGEVSPFGRAVNFIVGTKNVLAGVSAKCPAKADLSIDCRVNLIDFSIAAYWYRRANPPVSVDLNGDGKIDLIDFSIMAFYWTG